MKARIGVLLSGAGVMDGTEIQEATLTLYFLHKAQAQAVCLAPDAAQYHVIDHLSGRPEEGARQMLVESARICRGDITSLKDTEWSTLDGLILPGGYGVVKNLCDYAVRGRKACVREDVRDLIRAMVDSGRPVGAMCIAPVAVALALRETDKVPYLTIGNDTAVAEDIAAFDAKHVNAGVNAIVMDEDLKVVSTPAYMLGPGISEVADGIEKLVNQVLAWV